MGNVYQAAIYSMAKELFVLAKQNTCHVKLFMVSVMWLRNTDNVSPADKKRDALWSSSMSTVFGLWI